MDEDALPFREARCSIRQRRLRPPPEPNDGQNENEQAKGRVPVENWPPLCPKGGIAITCHEPEPKDVHHQEQNENRPVQSFCNAVAAIWSFDRRHLRTAKPRPVGRSDHGVSTKRAYGTGPEGCHFVTCQRWPGPRPGCHEARSGAHGLNRADRTACGPASTALCRRSPRFRRRTSPVPWPDGG